ncbi:hypothetical protein J6W20_06125 [bacterium]|nr:hypothetical protein [bacterium]
MVVDFKEPVPTPIANPSDVEINFEVEPKKPALIYPWQMAVDYVVPKEVPTTYPSELSIERSDIITDDFIVDLAHDIIDSMVEKSEFPQALDLSNLQVAPTPILVSDPSDIDVQLNFDEFKKEPIKASYPTIVRLNRASEVVDPFILDFAKAYHEAQEAKKPALVYP